MSHTVDKLKLHYTLLPKSYTGGAVKIIKNNCLELRMFFSKTNDISLLRRDAIGGFFDLTFLNEQHDYTDSKAFQDQTKFSVGSNIDFTQDLFNIRKLHGDTSIDYLVFFCPFLDPANQDLSFAFETTLVKTSSQIGTTPSVEQYKLVSRINRITEIFEEVKGYDGVVSNVLTRIKESSQNYYEISERKVNSGFDLEDQPDVKQFTILPNDNEMEMIELIATKENFYMKSKKPLTALIVHPNGTEYVTKEAINEVLDLKFTILKEDEDADQLTAKKVYMLIYSSEKLDDETRRIDLYQGRLLTENNIDLFISKYELDEEINAVKGIPWWLILIIVFLLLLLILLIVFLILYFVCKCFRQERKSERKTIYETNETVEPHNPHEDDFGLPVIVNDKVESKISNKNSKSNNDAIHNVEVLSYKDNSSINNSVPNNNVKVQYPI